MLRPGTRFAGRFRVAREIATGGMGAVYEVLDENNQRRRALKVMLPHLVTSRAQRERFGVEALVGARIESAHVVEVLDRGVDDQGEAATGMPWLLMEYLEGETLDVRVWREGALPPGDVARLFEHVGHALGAAHRAGVVHLDLKPQNLFLERPRKAGEGWEVKVLDFGIARVIDAGRTSAELTTQGGTLEWMAPEQAEQGERVRPSVDIWALGLIAFYVVTGRAYWVGLNVPEGQRNGRALLTEVLVKPLVPASQRARELGVEGRLPAGFDAWFARCLVREPEARFQHADEAAAALLALLGDASPSARPTPGVAPTVVSAPPASTSTEVGALPWQRAPAPPATPPVTSRRARLPVRLGLGAVLGALILGGSVALVFRLSRPWGSSGTRGPCPEGMLWVPAGTFQMGSPEGEGEADEHPRHAVRLGAFCVDRTEVTVEAYRACMTAGRCAPPGVGQACNQVEAEATREHPVNCVDWMQAVGYCRWKGRRLPTEAEWEYAARGTDGRRYPWGDEAPRDQLCWSGVGRRQGTCEAGAFPDGASPFGILDMVGGVWEWTAGTYAPYAASQEGTAEGSPGAAEETYHPLRGAAWDFGNPMRVRAAYRGRTIATARIRNTGFRCAQELP